MSVTNCFASEIEHNNVHFCNTIIMVYDNILLFWKVCSLERIAEICRTFRPVNENDTPRSRTRQWRHEF